VDADVVLHPAGRIERVVRRRERRHDLVADRLDHRSVVLLGRRSHDLDAGQYHVAGAQVAHDLVDARAADHIGEQDGEFYVFSHDLFSLSPPQVGGALPGALALYIQRDITLVDPDGLVN
jgi:hypothetical protein